MALILPLLSFLIGYWGVQYLKPIRPFLAALLARVPDSGTDYLQHGVLPRGQFVAYCLQLFVPVCFLPYFISP